MRPLGTLFRETLTRGVLFLLPLGIVLFVMHKGVLIVQKLLGPISHRLHFLDFMPAHVVAYVVSLLILVLFTLVVGLIALSAPARAFSDGLEARILRRVPGYAMVRSMAHGSLGVADESDVKTVLANIDDAWLIGFLIEEGRDGLLTVFVPSAPTPTGGSLYFLDAAKVRRVDVPVKDAIRCITQLGVGAAALLAKARPAGAGLDANRAALVAERADPKA